MQRQDQISKNERLEEFIQDRSNSTTQLLALRSALHLVFTHTKQDGELSPSRLAPIDSLLFGLAYCRLYDKDKLKLDLYKQKTKLTDTQFHALCIALKKNYQLKLELNGFSQALSIIQINRLISILENCQSLVKLDLSGQSLTKDQIRRLLEIASEKAQEISLVLSKQQLLTRQSLLEDMLKQYNAEAQLPLVINSVPLFKNQADELLTNLEKTPPGRPEQLDLTGIPLSATQIKQITELLSNIHFLSLSELSPSAELKRLFQALASNDSITELNLSGVKLSPEDTKALGNALGQNTILVKLNLSNCRLDCDKLIAISRGLMKNHGLQSIDLRNNDIRERGLEILASSLEHAANETLHSLYAPNSPLNESLKEVLLDDSLKQSFYFKQIENALEQNPKKQDEANNTSLHEKNHLVRTKSLPQMSEAEITALLAIMSTTRPQTESDSDSESDIFYDDESTLPETYATVKMHKAERNSTQHSYHREKEAPVLSFLSGMMGLGIGMLIGLGLILGGILLTTPVGWGIAVAIAVGGLLAGAVIGGIAGTILDKYTVAMKPVADESTETVRPGGSTGGMNLSLNIPPVVEKTSEAKLTAEDTGAGLSYLLSDEFDENSDDKRESFTL